MLEKKIADALYPVFLESHNIEFCYNDSDVIIVKGGATYHFYRDMGVNKYDEINPVYKNELIKDYAYLILTALNSRLESVTNKEFVNGLNYDEETLYLYLNNEASKERKKVRHSILSRNLLISHLEEVILKDFLKVPMSSNKNLIRNKGGETLILVDNEMILYMHGEYKYIENESCMLNMDHLNTHLDLMFKAIESRESKISKMDFYNFITKDEQLLYDSISKIYV